MRISSVVKKIVSFPDATGGFDKVLGVAVEPLMWTSRRDAEVAARMLRKEYGTLIVQPVSGGYGLYTTDYARKTSRRNKRRHAK